jgi:hypothetical protein
LQKKKHQNFYPGALWGRRGLAAAGPVVDYNTDDWVNLATQRKAVRDDVRARFWATAGATSVASPAEVTGAPQSMRVSIVSLLKVTRDGGLDTAHAAFLTTIAKSLQTVGLGKTGLGLQAANNFDITAYTTRALQQFFTLPYHFDGPQGPGD